MNRIDQLHHWLEQDCQLSEHKVEALPADASFRRYYRVTTESQSFIAMDAPPEKEDTLPFAKIAQELQALDIQAPKIFHHDIDNGFMLLSDFGNKLLLNELTPTNAKNFYQQALQEITKLNTCQQFQHHPRPNFDATMIQQELALCTEWFITQHLQLTLTEQQQQCVQATFDFLTQSLLAQPQAIMHRDYHSRNLMLLDDGTIGVIDFQDAVIGPVTYDPVSLLKDCYIVWPQAFREELLLEHQQQLIAKDKRCDVNKETFIRWFDLTGMQRHLKVLGIFARKYHRDQDDSYLGDLPRTLHYIKEVSAKYPELKEFDTLLTNVILKRFSECQTS